MNTVTTAEEYDAWRARATANRDALDEAVRGLTLDERGTICECLLGYVAGEVDPRLWLAGLRYAQALWQPTC